MSLKYFHRPRSKQRVYHRQCQKDQGGHAEVAAERYEVRRQLAVGKEH